MTAPTILTIIAVAIASLFIIVRRYRCTIATRWYDENLGRVREVEMHFIVARAGPIRTNRRKLANRGATYIRRDVFRHHGRWISKPKLRISFEREEPATRSDHRITVTPRALQYRGNEHTKQNLPSRLIPFRAVRDELGVPSHIVRILDMHHRAAERRRRQVQKWIKDVERRAYERARQAQRNTAQGR